MSRINLRLSLVLLLLALAAGYLVDAVVDADRDLRHGRLRVPVGGRGNAGSGLFLRQQRFDIGHRALELGFDLVGDFLEVLVLPLELIELGGQIIGSLRLDLQALFDQPLEPVERTVDAPFRFIDLRHSSLSGNPGLRTWRRRPRLAED